MSSHRSSPSHPTDVGGSSHGGAFGVAPPAAAINAGCASGSAPGPEGIESENPMMPGDKPFFDVCMGKTEIASTYYMRFPPNALALLPRTSVQARVKVVGGRLHLMQWFDIHKLPRFDQDRWRAFVTENEIKRGDFIMFEVHKSTSEELEMRAHILHPKIPPELEAHLEGRSAGTAINLD